MIGEHMLRVTIEHLPSTGNKPRELLAELDICNVGGSNALGDYTYQLKSKHIKGITTGTVLRYQRTNGFLPLVVKVFRDLWGL